MKKVIFFVILIALLVLVPVTIFRTTAPVFVIQHPAFFTNFLQRIVGLTLFVILFAQIIIGAFMKPLTEKLGVWLFKFHIFEGGLIYLLAIAHPILFTRDPYKAFVNLCLICNTTTDFYYTLGRISFWLLTVSVFATVFKNSTTWLKKNWRGLHILNYVIFLLVGAHGFLLGTDFKIQPFYSFATVAYIIVVGVIIFVELPRLFKNFKYWLSS